LIWVVLLADAYSNSCGLNQPQLRQTQPVGVRYVWLSIFNAKESGNSDCSLGQTGQIMASVLLQETGSQCMTPQLNIWGTKSYYRLELSDDGTIVRRLNAGCFEHTCSDCKYERTMLGLDQCVSETTDNSLPFSFALVKYTSSSTPCIGPYSIRNPASVTAVLNVDVGIGDSNDICGPTQANCSAALFALTLTDAPSECVTGSFFHCLLDYAYSITNHNNRTFSMNFCGNTSICSPLCPTVFSNLPLNECRPTRLGNFGAHVELIQTNELVICQASKPWALSWVFGAVGGALAVCFALILAIYQYRRYRLRKSAAITNSDDTPVRNRTRRSKQAYGAIN